MTTLFTFRQSDNQIQSVCKKKTAKMFTWEGLLGKSLLARKEKVATSDALAGKNLVGLYFSASWCRPCREFTPILSTVYRNMGLAMHKELGMKEGTEVVMLSLDRDEETFQLYHSQTPFLAVPYDRRDVVKDLWNKFEVKTIPTLVFVDAGGDVVEREGACGAGRNPDGTRDTTRK